MTRDRLRFSNSDRQRSRPKYKVGPEINQSNLSLGHSYPLVRGNTLLSVS